MNIEEGDENVENHVKVDIHANINYNIKEDIIKVVIPEKEGLNVVRDMDKGAVVLVGQVRQAVDIITALVQNTGIHDVTKKTKKVVALRPY